MQKIVVLFFLSALSFTSCSQKKSIPSKELLAKSVHSMINNIRDNYIYLADKDVDIECIRASYLSKLNTIKTRDDLVLFFEYLMDEFYDSHLILSTNIEASFRLHAPIYAKTENGKTYITDTWYSKIKKLKTNIIGAEIIEFNGYHISIIYNSEYTFKV